MLRDYRKNCWVSVKRLERVIEKAQKGKVGTVFYTKKKPLQSASLPGKTATGGGDLDVLQGEGAGGKKAGGIEAAPPQAGSVQVAGAEEERQGSSS